jgi:hypothetical protein
LSSSAAAADDRLLKDGSDLWLPLPPDKVPPSDLIALGDSGVRKCRVLRSVADPGSLSRIRIFSIPDPGSKRSGTESASKNLSIFNPKNCFKALGNMIRDVHPVFQDPGVKKALDPGSAHWSYGGCEFKKGEYPENFSILFINTT